MISGCTISQVVGSGEKEKFIVTKKLNFSFTKGIFSNLFHVSSTANNHHPPFEYLTETPYYSNEDDIVNSTATSNTVAKAHETPNEPFATTHSGKYLLKTYILTLCSLVFLKSTKCQ